LQENAGESRDSNGRQYREKPETEAVEMEAVPMQ
jgi:hypothetical protein